jgi:hypothetical protein
MTPPVGRHDAPDRTSDAPDADRGTLVRTNDRPVRAHEAVVANTT